MRSSILLGCLLLCLAINPGIWVPETVGTVTGIMLGLFVVMDFVEFARNLRG